MSTAVTVKELIERNKELAKTHTPKPNYGDFPKLGLSLPKVLIITCVDPRCTPEHFLGLQAADAAVIRNVCGHVAPAIDNILALDALMTFNELMIIHHSDCGALLFTDDGLRSSLKKQHPEHASKIDSVESYGAITDVAQSIRDDLSALKAAPLIRKELVESARGYLFDIKTGLLSPVQ